MKKIITICCLLLSISSFSATPPLVIIYVKANASGANNGTSWADAYTKLQDALAAATSGQIWVAAATYYPDEGVGLTNNNQDYSFRLKAGISVYGGFAGTETQLNERNWQNNVTTLSGDLMQNDGANFTNNGDNTQHVVQVNDGTTTNTAVLDGFTITAGNAAGVGADGIGGGFLNSDSSPTLANLIFSANSARDNGGGLYNGSTSSAITNCSFSGNRAANGGGIYISRSSSKLTNCSFSGNSASSNGGGIYNVNSSPTLTNCSFSGNSATSNGGGICNVNSSPTVINSILWGDTGGEIFNNGGTTTVTYSIVQGGFSGTGNLNQDPLFVIAANGDLRLLACSPAINNGTLTGAPSTDLDGNPRPALGGVDIGAYEFQPPATSGIVYVNAAATGANNGSSWINAFTKLQDALTKTKTCYGLSQIWVAAGTYYPDEGAGIADNNFSIYFQPKTGVAIYGGFAGGETELDERNWGTNITVLSGDLKQDDAPNFANTVDNSLHVVSLANVNSTAVLDGFTITAGFAYPKGSEDGGGIFNVNASPTIANCIISGNYAASGGGGMCNVSSSPTLINCSFVGNRATNGGGIFNNSSSSPTMTNCTFLRNSASSGAAIYNFGSSPTVTNCTFFGNSASSAAAIYNLGSSPGVTALISSPILTNCILWGDIGGEMTGGTPVVTYSIIQGGYTGDGNLDKDPLFIDAANGNLRLQICSPAIDAGNDAAVTAANDLDGNTRIKNSRVDMGAYEYNGTVYTFYKDNDGDGYGSTAQTFFCSTPPSGYVSNNTDCNDDAANGGAAIHPGATEICDGLDNNCNGQVDEGLKNVFYRDADGDGYGNPSITEQACSAPGGYVSNNTDCNDDAANSGAAIHPGATEICDGLDNNCDGQVDEGVKNIFYIDADRDGYGNSSVSMQSCTAPDGYVSNNTDCNDGNASTHPGAAEVCGNGIDDNCNGQVDEAGCSICTNATGLTTTNINSTSAKLNWIANADPVQWQVEYKTIATGSRWIKITLPGETRSVTISSFKANQNYNWHIKAKCGKTWTAFSNAVSFKTLASTSNILARSSNEEAISLNGVEEQSPALKLYPNPSKGQFMVDLQIAEKINGTAKLQLIDITGRTIYIENAVINNGALQKKVSISSLLSSGIYTVKIIVNDKSYFSKLIYEK